MDPITLFVLVAAIAGRKGISDFFQNVPYMVRGGTPPAHERRMAEMTAREAHKQRRHQIRMSRGQRPQGKGRAYVGALWDHSMEQALAKKRVKWQQRDPVKLANVEERVQRKLDGTYRGPIRRAGDRGRQLLDKAKATARGTAFDVADRAVTDPDTDYVDGEQHRQQDRAAAVNGHQPPAGDDASVTVEPTPEGEAATEVPEPEPVSEPASSSPEMEESTMTTAPSEAIGVDEFAAALEQHRQAAEGGTPALEGLIASAQQQHVGPSVTDPLTQAQELYGQFVAKIEEAQQGLQQSVNVGESYTANPDAGDAQFVTNGARS